jgi:hypothetical protein
MAITELLQRDNLAKSTSFKIALALIFVTLALSACVVSHEPLLTDAQPLLGRHFEAHLYEDFQNAKAGDFHVATYRWEEGKYVRASGLARDAASFVVRELSGDDFIIQSSGGLDKTYNYWVGRRVIPGVYLIVPISEEDVDVAARSAACANAMAEGICTVETYDHLVMLARGTASKPLRNPALGVILPRTSTADSR